MKFRAHVRRAIEVKGSQQKLADAAGCSQQQISFLLNDAENISAEMAIKIDLATDGEVRRSDMRPDLFPRERAEAAA